MSGVQQVKRNGQITVPKVIRERIDLKDGDIITVELHGQTIVITPVSVVIKTVDAL